MQLTVHHFNIVSSTMDVARDMAQQGAPEGTVVTANAQSAGRGRGDHTWYSPPEQSLYLSIVLRPTLPVQQASWINMIATLAVRDVIADIIPSCIVRIKWFNDVLLNSRKVCGILVESSITDDHLDYAVLGIGLNVNTTFDTAPPDVQSRATSMLSEYRDLHTVTQLPLDRAKILERLLAKLNSRYDELLVHRASPVSEYALYLDTIGRNVRLNVGEEIVAGVALRITEDGALMVLTAHGEYLVRSGEMS